MLSKESFSGLYYFIAMYFALNGGWIPSLILMGYATLILKLKPLETLSISPDDKRLALKSY